MEICVLKSNIMQTIHQTISASYLRHGHKESIITRFFNWTKGQEKYRYGWLAFILTVHGCVLAPIALYLVFANGANIALCTTVSAALAACLITNLAALPTKITIPVFLVSVVADLAVIAISLATVLG
jgi:hypothetical protein